ncbi:MAG: hypothetical protein HYW79_01040 [Parcubacteria group bacterium]|nr:hypothetical protein [Parcubacteria group bacterium]
MRRLLSAFLTVATLIVVSNAFASPDIVKLSKELPADILKDASRIPDKPYFLLGIESKAGKSQWEQYLEIRKMMHSQIVQFTKAGNSLIDRAQPEYRADDTLQSTVEIAGRKVQVLYIGHRFTEDGMYALKTRFGEKNLAEFSPLYEKYKTRWAVGDKASWGISDKKWLTIRQLLSHQQFERVKQFVHEEVIRSAANENTKYFKAMKFFEKTMAKRAAVLDDPDYIKRASEPIKNTLLNTEDILPVPHVRTEDFLPDLFLFGPGSMFGGMTLIGLPQSERVVFLDMRAAMADYIRGGQSTAAHEFVHVNKYLQNFAMGAYFDVEIFAEMATGVWQADLFSYFWHPYYAHWRDLANIYFGYDTREVQQRLFPGEVIEDFSVVDINRKEFEENAMRVEAIAGEFKGFIEKLYVEFYSDPLFWSAVNTKFCDKAATLRIMFALYYEPAGLFDPKKTDVNGNVISAAVQTKEWLMKEEESGRITRLAKLAMDKTGTLREKDKKEAEESEKELPKLFNQFKCPVQSNAYLASRGEQIELASALGRMIERAKAGDGLARAMLIRATGNAFKEKQSFADLIPRVVEFLKKGVWR